jgi:type I restriction-modification system DNA methylase subunit
MDASQYKDYILTLLFMKYVSDKYGGKKDPLIEIPEGGSFADMVKLKGDKEVGAKKLGIGKSALHYLRRSARDRSSFRVYRRTLTRLVEQQNQIRRRA